MKFEMAHWYRGVLHPWKVCMGVGWFLGDGFLTQSKDIVLDLVLCCVDQGLEKCEM